MKRIVTDTGPLLHLQEANVLDILQLAGPVHIPPAVYAELVSLDDFWHGALPEWLSVESLQDAFVASASRWLQAGLLDPGEAEALALAVQIGADWLLTDDTAARVLAQQQGLEVHGSLGVVLWAAATDHFDLAQADNALDALARSSLWVSSHVLAEAKAALRQIFA